MTEEELESAFEHQKAEEEALGAPAVPKHFKKQEPAEVAKPEPKKAPVEQKQVTKKEEPKPQHAVKPTADAKFAKKDHAQSEEEAAKAFGAQDQERLQPFETSEKTFDVEVALDKARQEK